MEPTPRERRLIEKLWELAGGETARKNAKNEHKDESGRRRRDGRGVVVAKPHGPRTEPEESGGPRRDGQGYRKDKPFDPRTRGVR